MSVVRVFALLLAMLAVPVWTATASATVPAPLSAPSEDEADDACDWVDDEEATTEDEYADESEWVEETEARTVDDEDVLAPEEDDDLTDEDEPSDDELCTGLDDEEGEDAPPAEIAAPDTSKLAKSGVLTTDVSLSGQGVVDSTLTSGGTAARVAKVRVLATAHRRVARAGTVTLRLRLTPQGRRILRRGTRAVRLTLTTRVRLADGRTVSDAKPLSVKPAKKPRKRGRH